MSPTIFGGADGARLIARQGRQRSVLFVSAGLLQPKNAITRWRGGNCT